MRLLFFSDSHLAERPPASRNTSYADDVFAKLAEVKEIAATCDVAIFGGDALHTPSVPHGLVRRLISFLRDWPCPLYIVVGNHDLPADGMEGLDRTALGVVLEGLADSHVQLLYHDEIVRGADGTVIHLSAGHWTPSIDGDATALMMGEGAYERTGDEIMVKVMHSMIVVSGEDHPFKCVVVNDDLHSDADVVLVGHCHWATPETTVNGTLYVGPGSITRTQRSEGELKRQVGVSVLTITKDLPIACEFVPLKSMRPSAEVFTDASPDKTVERDERFSGYVAVLETGLGVGDGVEEALAAMEARAPVGVAAKTREYLREAGL